jgi:predicted MFS family arabinose efflux permease
MMGEAKSLDWKGLLLAGACTIGVLNGLVELRKEPAVGSALLVLGLVCLIAFVVYQRRADAPLMNMKLFGYRQFSMGAMVAFIYGAGLFGSTYLLPVYMQMALEFSPSEAGLILLPAGIALGVTIMLAGKLADRVAPYILVSAGLLLLAVSFALMATESAGTAYVALMACAIIGRVGLGFVLPALSLGAMRGVDAGLIAQGASAVNFLRQLGGAIGVSLVGIVLEWRLAAHHVALAGQAINPRERLLAFNETFLFVALICATAVLAAWRMRPASFASRDS